MKKQPIVFIGMVLASWFMSMLLHCTNPVDEPSPLTWRSNMTIPLTNERFFIGEKMDSLFDFKHDVKVVKKDTITFTVMRRDTTSYERTENAFDTMYFKVKLGVLSVKGAPEQDYSLPPFSGAGRHTATLKVPIEKMRNILFYDTVNNYLNIRFRNSSDVQLSDVSMSLASSGAGSVSNSDSVAQISPQSSHVFRFDVAGKKIIDSIEISIGFTNPDDNEINVGIDFTLNDLKVFSMDVLDSLLAFSREYVNRFELSDSIKINHVDIAQGLFIYKVLNHCGVAFSLSCIHEHLWNSTYCQENDINNLSDFQSFQDGTIDSSKFRGTIPNQQINAAPNAQELIQTVDLSNCRLFTVWDTAKSKSITSVKYTVATHPIGDIVTVSAIDSLQFTLATVAFKFREMDGTFMLPMDYEADTQKVAIDLPWNSTVKDSLRGKFVLFDVGANLQLKTIMSGSSNIDTLDINFVVFDPESTSVQSSQSITLINAANDSLYDKSIDITDIANCFSDSIAIGVKMHIPAGTKFRFTDTIASLNSDIIGRMVIDAYTDFRLNAKLDWRVLDTVNMDLGSSRFPLPEVLNYFGKMRSRSGIFEMKVRNNTNLQVLLYTLVATDALMDTLDSLRMNDVYTYLKKDGAATEAGYINLFGENGVTIPQRDTTVESSDTVELDERQINKILDADSLNFRWWIQFIPQSRDALKKTDFLDIKSRLGIRGTNNADSLMIWK